MTTREVVEALLRKAERKLRSAEYAPQGGFYDDAASRAYYAVYHAAQALLASRGIKARSHAGLRALVGEHFVATGALEREYAMILSNERDLRENGDYAADIEVPEADARGAVEDARRFLERAREIVGI